MEILILIASIFIGELFICVGSSNITKTPRHGEKTAIGKVKKFGFIGKGHTNRFKYEADIKVGLKKYHIESYTMPWLKEGEEVKIQTTGKQQILGNDRLNAKGKLQYLIGNIMLFVPIIILYLLSLNILTI